MNKILKHFLIICTVLLSIAISGEEAVNDDPTNEGNYASPEPAGSTNGAASLKNYSPLAVYDYRLRVKNITFLRKYAANGRGEMLNVQVDFESNADKTNDYSIYVLALNESNAIEPVARSVAPYPKWRSIDPLKAKKIINFSHLVGGNKIKPEELHKAIWKGLEPKGTGLFGKDTYEQRKKQTDEAQKRGERVKLGEPALDEYILYLTKNPKDALKFKVYGNMSGAINEKERFSTDYKPATTPEDEGDFYNLKTFPNNHSYTIHAARNKTTVFTHHYTAYRPDYYFFNKVVVLVFDPSRKTNKLVHRSIHDITGIQLKR